MTTKLAPLAVTLELDRIKRMEFVGSRILSRAHWSTEDQAETDSHRLTLVNPDDVNESSVNRFFAFWVEDCFSPPIYLVAVQAYGHEDRGFEEAYEIFCDHAADHCHLLIEEPDLKDYLDESGEYQGNYTSDGRPIDTEAINGEALTLVKVEMES